MPPAFGLFSGERSPRLKRRDWIVLAIIQHDGYLDKERIRQRSGLPIEYLEDSLRTLRAEGYLSPEGTTTEKTAALVEANRPRRAVILAAGAGVRMLPELTPKGLLTLNDEPLIERCIHQLHDVGVFDITAVVGYRWEAFEYLADKFGVRLIINEDYASHDSLRSLAKAAEEVSLENCYIVPSDLWFSRNPFSETEYFSWYAVSGIVDDDSYVRLNRNMELRRIDAHQSGNAMLGLGYLLPGDADVVTRRLRHLDAQRRHARSDWEEALFQEGKMLPYAKVMVGQPYFIIKTYEQLGDLADETEQRRSSMLSYIAQAIHLEDKGRIRDMHMLKKGMTNKLMRFSCDGENYLLRIPGEGSNKLTNRREEAVVYSALAGKGISDEIVHISGEIGFKITRFWEGSRGCDKTSETDVAACMALLGKFHAMGLSVPHDFNIFEKLAYYESLRGEKSTYHNYEEVRAQVVALKDILDALPGERTLCHIDSVPDNFLFTPQGLYLIDWEYAGMCDPWIDVAMFCISAAYDKEGIDRTMALYAGREPTLAEKAKVYCYVAAGGLLWSQWSEYKQQFGVNYSEYAVRQYRYARHFPAYAQEAYAQWQREGGGA